MAAKDNGARDGKKCDRMYKERRREKHTQTHKGRMKKYMHKLSHKVFIIQCPFFVCVFVDLQL